jgi:hypothetical protein
MSQVSGLRLIQTAHTPLLRRLVPANGGNDWTVNDVLPAILRTLLSRSSVPNYFQGLLES